MSLANPLAKATFADQLQIADVKFMPQWQQQMSATGGGETLYSDRAPMRWMADITCGPQLHADAEGIMALINSRAGGLKTVLIYNPKLPYPSSDPDGSTFGAATPVVGTITDQLHVAFTGMPIGYVIPLGTYFQIIFGTSRYYLGQFAEPRTADGAGAVASVEITPALPASVAAGDAVTLLKPSGKFRIVPNSAYPSTVGALHSAITFSAEQTYGA
ncbi:MAG: hypothetical protein ABI216_00625 [Devosia sp.]